MNDKPNVHNAVLGVIYMTIFGVLWLSNPLASGLTLNILLSLVLIVIYVIIVAPLFVRIVRKNSGVKELDPSINTKFSIIGAAETVAIIAAIILCNRLHDVHAISAVIAIVVGIHFFPLARLFKMHLYYYVGGALVVIGGVGLLFLSQLFATSISSYFVPYLTAITLFVTSYFIAKS